MVTDDSNNIHIHDSKMQKCYSNQTEIKSFLQDVLGQHMNQSKLVGLTAIQNVF